MAAVRTLGKNTIGDNNKMKVAMRDYDMSTHDISTVFRSSIGVGMLVPFCKILCQKGDIIDINLINKTLSSLKGKQKEAIEEYLSGINSNTPNFRQGLKSLRKIMSGKTVRTKGKGGYVSKSNRLGRVGKLKDEDVLDIRKNLKNDKDMLSKSLFYAIKYKVPKKTIFNVVRGISYKNVKEKKEE